MRAKFSRSAGQTLQYASPWRGFARLHKLRLGLTLFSFEEERGRRSAAKLLRRDEALLSGGNIRSVLLREHALTGRHVQQLRQIRIVRAADFFIDDTGQLHRNRDQRTHMKHFALW